MADVKINEVTIGDEKIHLKKDVFGWRVVNPVKVEGKINYKNLFIGNKKVIIFTILWLLIMGFIFYGVSEMIGSCKDMAKDPCRFTDLDCSRKTNYSISNLSLGGDNNEP